jgi:hypothetical protein
MVDGDQAPVAADDLFQRQPGLLPPLHVHGVAEGADHQDAGALLGVGVLGGHDRHPRTEQRRDGVLAEQTLVALVVRVGHHRDAGGQQLRTGGGDLQLAAALHREADVVEEALLFAVLDLRLGHRGLEVHVPHGGRLDVVHQALVHQIEEAQLGNVAAVVVDGGVLLGPVDGQAQIGARGARRPPRPLR